MYHHIWRSAEFKFCTHGILYTWQASRRSYWDLASLKHNHASFSNLGVIMRSELNWIILDGCLGPLLGLYFRVVNSGVWTWTLEENFDRNMIRIMRATGFFPACGVWPQNGRTTRFERGTLGRRPKLYQVRIRSKLWPKYDTNHMCQVLPCLWSLATE